MRNVLKREECIKSEGNLLSVAPFICLRSNGNGNGNAFHLFVCEATPSICLETRATPSTYLSAKTLICLETTTTPSTYLSAKQRLPLICLRSNGNGNASHLSGNALICLRSNGKQKIPYFSGRFGVGDRCPLPPF